jgi:hypothetical protein
MVRKGLLPPFRNSYCKVRSEMRVSAARKNGKYREISWIAPSNCSIYSFFGDKALTLESNGNTNILDREELFK